MRATYYFTYEKLIKYSSKHVITNSIPEKKVLSEKELSFAIKGISKVYYVYEVRTWEETKDEEQRTYVYAPFLVIEDVRTKEIYRLDNDFGYSDKYILSRYMERGSAYYSKWTEEKRPNRIGIPTKKKLLDWFNYWEHDKMEEIRITNAVRARKKSFLIKLDKAGIKYKLDDFETQGCAYKGPFELSFYFNANGDVKSYLFFNSEKINDPVDYFIKLK